MGCAACHAADPCQQVIGKKDKEVQQGNDRQQNARQAQAEQRDQNIDSKQGGKEPRQIFDLYRDNQKQDNGVWVEHGKSKEHGHIDIRGAGQTVIDPGCQRQNDDAQQCQRHAAEIVDIEFCSAPFPLQGCADIIIEKQGNNQPNRVAVGWHEDKCNQAPDFAVQQIDQVKGKKADGAGLASCQQI